MIDSLIAFFEKHIELSEEEKSFLKEQITVETFQKNQFLLQDGDVSRAIYFVIEGAIRLFYRVGIEEKTAFFYFDQMFVSSYESFTKQLPCKHNLQAIEQTTVATITTEAAYLFLELHPKFDFLARVMMEEELIVCQEVISTFITMNAEERYLNLLSSRPEIIQRIPQYQLASFLGVTPETLSRIRKRISYSQ